MYAIAARSSDSELGRRAALLRQHRAALLGVLRSRGATNPRIFGSVARGKEREGSDIDLLVDLPEGYSLVDLAGLSLEISELLGEAVDLATPDLLKSDYLKAALKDACAVVSRRCQRLNASLLRFKIFTYSSPEAPIVMRLDCRRHG